MLREFSFFRCFLHVAVLLSISAWASAQGVIYVDQSNQSGMEDGASWSTAFTTLQAAVDVAPEGGAEIWVAEGVYSEVRQSFMHEQTAKCLDGWGASALKSMAVSKQVYEFPAVDTGSLVLKSGIELYGGFVGTELSKLERAAGVYTTIDGSTSRGGDAAYHVVVAGGNNKLDGFIISGGDADRYLADGYPDDNYLIIRDNARCGGGIYASNADVELVECIVRNNAADRGAGIYTYRGKLRLEKVLMESNYSYFHGGSAIYQVGDTGLNARVFHASGCAFNGNVNSDRFDAGGDTLFVNMDGTKLLENCQFFNNVTGGAGVIGSYCGNTSLFGCYFSGNQSVQSAAVLISNNSEICSSVFVNNVYPMGCVSSNNVLSHCTFYGNYSHRGYSVFADDEDVKGIENCIIWGNSEPIGLSTQALSANTIRHSLIQGGARGDVVLDTDPQFVSPSLGDFSLLPNSPCRDTGSFSTYCATDINGIPRPQGVVVDMGAYEYIFTDKDGDGVDDGWEISTGKNPADPSDGLIDGDNDGLTDWQEYMNRTDGTNPNDPPLAVYVRTDGSDSAGNGSAVSPWATLGFALQRTAYSVYRAATIYLGPGEYNDALVMHPNLSVIGAGSEQTVIQYYAGSEDQHRVVTGASGAVLRDCMVTVPGFYSSSIELIRVDDIPMTVENVTFDGNDNLYSVGLIADGVNSSDSVFRDCTFRRLYFGVQAVNTAINITGCLFDGIRGDAVFVRLPDLVKSTESLTPMLGLKSDEAHTGSNIFRSVQGYLVINANNSVTQAENNDWGIYDEAAIAAKMSGPVDFDPYIDNEEEPDDNSWLSCLHSKRNSPPVGDIFLVGLSAVALLGMRRMIG